MLLFEFENCFFNLNLAKSGPTAEASKQICKGGAFPQTDPESTLGVDLSFRAKCVNTPGSLEVHESFWHGGILFSWQSEKTS